jgi:hypothetical protein
MSTTLSDDILWRRISGAVEAIRSRMLRACMALEAAGVPYSVVGGNAVAVWVGTVDEGAIRNTRDVDLLIRRADLPSASTALTHAGFVPAEVFGVTTFLDGPDAKPSESIHIVFAGEKVFDDSILPSPDVTEAARPTTYQVLALEPLVRMKLTAFRRKDQVHIQDLIGVGLIDASWLARLPPSLAERLKELLDDPRG